MGQQAGLANCASSAWATGQRGRQTAITIMHQVPGPHCSSHVQLAPSGSCCVARRGQWQHSRMWAVPVRASVDSLAGAQAGEVCIWLLGKASATLARLVGPAHFALPIPLILNPKLNPRQVSPGCPCTHAHAEIQAQVHMHTRAMCHARLSPLFSFELASGKLCPLPTNTHMEMCARTHTHTSMHPCTHVHCAMAAPLSKPS